MLREATNHAFGDVEKTGLFTLKFHMLSQIIQPVLKIGNSSYVDASRFKYSNFTLITRGRVTFMKRGSTFKVTLMKMNKSFPKIGLETTKNSQMHRTQLGRGWFKKILGTISRNKVMVEGTFTRLCQKIISFICFGFYTLLLDK